MWDQIGETDSPGDLPGHGEHVAAVVDLALRAEPSCGATVVVAIDGYSGSGKTTLARGVVGALESHGSVEVLHMDHLYPGWDGLADSVGILARQVLEPLARSSPAAYGRWDWAADRWDGTMTVDPAAFLVVEGCGSSVLPAGEYASVRVFVEADREVRRRRGLERDGEAYRPHWERWAAQETALFDRDGTRARADLVIDTSTA